MDKSHNPPTLNASELKERGWTEGLIRRFLGPPDATAPNPRYRSAAPLRLWLLQRVEAIEASPLFAEALNKAKKHAQAAQKAAETRRELTLEQARTLPVTLERRPLEELLREARRHYEDLRGYPAHCLPWGQEDPFRDRICVNYLRHAATEYEEHLDEMYRRTGAREAYLLLWERITQAIASAYPELAHEAQKQLARRKEKYRG